MIDKAGHIAWAAEAVAVFQKHCGTGDEHAIADLICDLGHLADERGFDFLTEVKRGIGHWYAERHVSDRRDASAGLPLRMPSKRRSRPAGVFVGPPAVFRWASNPSRSYGRLSASQGAGRWPPQ
jgi:hypothetical protein